MTSILEPMLNYIARGPIEVIFSGTWAEGSMTYADMVFNMVKKVLHLPGVGSEKDAAAAAELATALFAHATPPVADAWLPAYFAEFWTRVAEVETSDLRQALLVAFATQMWYNPELFLRCTEQRGVTIQLFEVWMQKLSSLRRLKHRKVALLGLVQLLRMAFAQALPANLAQGLPHLVTTLAVQSKETLRLREKAASRRQDEDTESEDGTAEPGQMDQVLRKLQMASDNDDNEDNDSEALSDEGFDGMVHAAGGKLLDLN
ncbi:SAD2, partial [Symbiodinium necroappetens]